MREIVMAKGLVVDEFFSSTRRHTKYWRDWSSNVCSSDLGPLARSLSYPYHPHVTVAHDVPADMLDLAYCGLSDLSAEFRVEHFTEFEQTSDGTWVISREYPLTGPPH